MVLNPQDDREEHGLNLAPGVAERAPDPCCCSPQHQKRGPVALGLNQPVAGGIPRSPLEWMCPITCRHLVLGAAAHKQGSLVKVIATCFLVK